MRVIGITGPTGAGKTTVLQALESLGGVLIDADAVYHDLTRSSQAMQAELIARFGPVYDGSELDRKKLGAVVFQDEKALADLNRITHKYIARETQRRIEAAKAAGATAVGIDAIGLLESQLVDFCDCTRHFGGLRPPAGVRPEAQRLVPGPLRLHHREHGGRHGGDHRGTGQGAL